jgi:hypothetical protein
MLDANLILKASGAMPVASSPFTGTTIDFGAGDQQPLTYILNVTAIAATTTPTLDVKIQESDDDSVWIDFCAFEQATLAKGTKQYFVTAKANRRYRRYYAVVAGTSASFTADIGVDVAGIYNKF